MSEAPMFGASIARREDPALITGRARYTDDLSAPNVAHLAVARSQFGHAEITGIDTADAEALDGVIAVFTAEDVAASGLPADVPVRADFVDPAVPSLPMLADDRVYYQGQPVAVVVAEERYLAHDALDEIDVSYERLDAVVNARDAAQPDAPTIHEGVEDNVAYEWTVGDDAATDEAFANASHVTSLDLVNQRVVSNPLEPRGMIADYDPSDRRLTAWISTQAPHDHQSYLSTAVGIPEGRIRVIAPAVGGGFGTKGKFYPDEIAPAWCSIQLERPVKWIATRTESFLADAHGRDHVTHAELALDDDGSVLGLRVDTHAALGAFVSVAAPFVQTKNYGRLLSGQYRIPAIHCRVKGTFTNAAPIDAYRGAGRPEAVYVIERLMAQAARELEIDPTELRRQNFIPPSAFPYETPVGFTYDSGEYERALDTALELIEYDSLRDRQAELRREGRYLGIGFSCFVENAGGRIGSGVVRFRPDGTVQGYTSLTAHGQGHETTFAQVLADELGIPYDDIEIIQGDTDQIPSGAGTSASRSAVVGGNALAESAGKVIEKAHRVAAHRLEAAPEDIEFSSGAFHVTGAPDRSISIQRIAQLAYDGDALPDGEEPGLEATTFYDPTGLTFPFGTHVAVVEVDPDSGEISFERYVAVDDCGNVINPLVVEGQILGGLAQGLGQALIERAVYDDTGTLQTGSFQDYAMPRAESMPEVELEETVTPSPFNALGVKGVGEAGTTGSPPAVVNAIVDALAPFGVDHLDMPVTPERVWRAIDGTATSD